ncbi:GHMP kinase [Streptomyces sp. PR69]|uniref:GHMP family kinase ATP-binding protein n=1 Tax=Streptomyces sp. PR69 TaxID=2984950 RepID=UPI002263E414|nr:GHMP kinase [Streptomyces sp. PR69]
MTGSRGPAAAGERTAASGAAGAAQRLTGAGYASCHHGEILQGVFRDGQGQRVAGLVTLPLPGLGTRARFTRRPGTPPEDLSVTPADRAKALRAAALAEAECCRLGRTEPCGGRLRLDGDIPVGLGMGSSSSDVIAAVRAVAAAHGMSLTPQAIARLAVRAEQASDPLMLDGGPLLFAQREGRVLEVFGSALPPAVVVGCTLGGGRPVDTLALPRHTCGEADLDAYEELRTALRRAVADRDARLLGRVSTESARLGQRRLPQEEFRTLEEIAARVGACGVQIAHSGSVAGLLFDPAAEPADGLRRRLRDCATALAGHGMPVSRIFTTCDTPTRFTINEESFHGRAHSGVDRQAGPGASRRRTHLPAL